MIVTMKLPNFSIRTKVIFLIIFILVLMSIGVSFMAIYSRQQLLFAQQSRQRNNDDVMRNAILTVSQLQDLFARDYSFWDSMANAVSKRDKKWISTEFFGPLEIYKAEAVWVYTDQGELLFTEQRGGDHNIELKLDGDPALELKKISNTSFFEWNYSHLVKFVVSPIRSHLYEDSEIKGYLVIADEWDQEKLVMLGSLVSAKVYINDDKVTSSPMKSSYPLNNRNNEVEKNLIFEFSDNSLSVITSMVRQQQFLIGGLGLIGFILSIVALSKWVLLPLAKINKKLILATSLHDIGSLVDKKNEFELLSFLVDSHLEQASKLKAKNVDLRQTSNTLELALTDLEKSKRELKRELSLSRRLSQAVEAATDAIIITSKEREIVYVNPAWEELNGYSLQEVKGKNPRILKSNKTDKSVYSRMWQELFNGRPFTSEGVINKRKNGTVYNARISVFPVIENNEIVSFVGIAQDISKRKEVERMKTEFISLASHQLRTPLSAMRWFSELLLKSKSKYRELSAEQSVWITRMHQSTIRMIQMVNDLLNISRIESGRLKIEPKKVKVLSFLGDILEEFSPLLKKKKILHEIKVDKGVSSILVDPQLLREVMANILSNSIKYTLEHGKIHILVEADRDRTVWTVKDNGMGIPSDEQKNLFNRFFRGSNIQDMSIEGTGLGLYLVKLLVHAWGGEVWIESDVKVGTKVSFSISDKGMIAHKGEVDLTEGSKNLQLSDEVSS